MSVDGMTVERRAPHAVDLARVSAHPLSNGATHPLFRPRGDSPAHRGVSPPAGALEGARAPLLVLLLARRRPRRMVRRHLDRARFDGALLRARAVLLRAAGALARDRGGEACAGPHDVCRHRCGAVDHQPGPRAQSPAPRGERATEGGAPRQRRLSRHGFSRVEVTRLSHALAAPVPSARPLGKDPAGEAGGRAKPQRRRAAPCAWADSSPRCSTCLASRQRASAWNPRAWICPRS